MLIKSQMTPCVQSAGIEQGVEYRGDSKVPSDNIGDLKNIMTSDALKARGAAIVELSKYAPEKGMNLWRVNFPGGAEIHTLGTEHRNGILQEKIHSQKLVDCIKQKQFDVVYLEILNGQEEKLSMAEVGDHLNQSLSIGRMVEEAKASGNSKKIRIAEMRQKQFESTSPINKMVYDNLFSGAAPEIRSLETADSRLAHYQNYGAEKNQVDASDFEVKAGDDSFVLGDETESFRAHGDQLISTGKDHASCEARSNQWLVDAFFENKVEYENKKILWVVGANHIPGILVASQSLGAKFESVF